MKYQTRHWLFLAGVATIASSPVAVLTPHRLAVALLMVGIGGLLLSIAAITTPDEN
jgi:hypothetical protein